MTNPPPPWMEVEHNISMFYHKLGGEKINYHGLSRHLNIRLNLPRIILDSKIYFR